MRVPVPITYGVVRHRDGGYLPAYAVSGRLHYSWTPKGSDREEAVRMAREQALEESSRWGGDYLPVVEEAGEYQLPRTR